MGRGARRRFDELAAEHHHVDMYWFPHTDRMLTKRNSRLEAPVTEARPLSGFRGWLDDDFLSNTVFGAEVAAANLAPRVIPRINRLNARCSARAPTPTSRTGSSSPSDAWSSGRWSTPSRARPGSPR